MPFCALHSDALWCKDMCCCCSRRKQHCTAVQRPACLANPSVLFCRPRHTDRTSTDAVRALGTAQAAHRRGHVPPVLPFELVHAYSLRLHAADSVSSLSVCSIAPWSSLPVHTALLQHDALTMVGCRQEGSPLGHQGVISRLAQMDVRIHVASPRGVQWPSTIYKIFYGVRPIRRLSLQSGSESMHRSSSNTRPSSGAVCACAGSGSSTSSPCYLKGFSTSLLTVTVQGLSAEDMAAAMVSRSKADCVLVSASGWPAAHAHLRMLLDNSRPV